MSYLQEILEDMLSEARAKGTSHRRLKNGLHIKLHSQTDGHILSIARENVYPANKEWTTIMGHFPYNPNRVEFTKEQREKFFILTGKVPTKSALQMKFG